MRTLCIIFSSAAAVISLIEGEYHGFFGWCVAVFFMFYCIDLENKLRQQ